MFIKVLLIAVVLFAIWAEYEEMAKMFESPEGEAQALRVAPGASESARRSPKQGAAHSRKQTAMKEGDAKENQHEGSPTPKSRKKRESSKEEDAKEMLIKAIFQVFLLRGMRRKLVAPGTPADALLIAFSMIFMICLLCVIWFVIIFGLLKALEPVWDWITSFREERSESRQRDMELNEFRTAYVEHQKNSTSALVRRGSSFSHPPSTH